MEQFHGDENDFNAFVESFHGLPATDEDISLIKSLAIDAAAQSPVVSHTSFGMRLDDGTIHIYSTQIEGVDSALSTQATVELFPNVIDADSDGHTEDSDEPIVKFIFDSSQSTPVAIDRDIEDLSLEHVSKVIAIALQAAEQASDGLEAALFNHIAAIGTHIYAQTGELVIGCVAYEDQQLHFEDIARTIAVHYSPQLRQERANTVVVSDSTNLRITIHDYVSITPDEVAYYCDMPHVEIDVLENGSRAIGVCISQDGEAIVTYLTDEESHEQTQSMNPNEVEDISEELGLDQLRSDDAQIIIDHLMSIAAANIHPGQL